MRPTAIHRVKDTILSISWDDGHDGCSSLTVLRDGCPCAECSGETVLLRSYTPSPPDKAVPGRYDLVRIDRVGAYALQFSWRDGHATGIYTWDYLRSLCECPGCSHRDPVRSAHDHF